MDGSQFPFNLHWDNGNAVPIVERGDDEAKTRMRATRYSPESILVIDAVPVPQMLPCFAGSWQNCGGHASKWEGLVYRVVRKDPSAVRVALERLPDDVAPVTAPGSAAFNKP